MAKKMRTNILDSIAFQYALFYVAVVTALTFSLLIIGYGYVYYYELESYWADLSKEYRIVSQIEAKEKMPGLIEYTYQYRDVQSVKETLVSVLDKKTGEIYGALPHWPLHLTKWFQFLSFNVEANGVIQNFVGREIKRDAYDVIVFVSISDFFSRIKQIILLASQFMCGVIFFGVLGACIISRDLISRVAKVNDGIDRIIKGNLSERLPLPLREGELSMLAANANNMLERIEKLLQSKREFSNNIAHDLRTPLTRLRNNLEELSSKVGKKNTDLVESLIGETDGLLSTFNALLRITNVETEASKERFEEFDLANLLTDVIELYEPLAEEKHIHINVASVHSSFIKGDKNLLFQMFANLLDNAIKYGPEHSTVRLYSFFKQDTIYAGVIDQGDGISKDEQKKVFESFYRIESSRGLKPGNGLGLSLVSAVIDLHDADIELRNQMPGLNVEVRFKPLPANMYRKYRRLN
ncbi:MAG: HAMP domain-containing sensor histidine kinase [Pseudomonadota bacterium]